MNDLNKILEKAMKDPNYAKTLSSDTEGAMKEAGVTPTPEKTAALKASVDSLAKAHAAFHGGMRPD